MSVAVADGRAACPDGGDDGPFWMPLRWALCFAVILLFHAGAAWIAIRWKPAEEPASPLSPAAVMIDLAPLPAAPPARPSEIPPAPKEAALPPPPSPPPEPVIDPPSPELPPPEPVIEQALPPEAPSPAPQIDVPLPPKPPPKPPERHRQVIHAPPRPRPDPRPPAPAAAAPPQVEAPPAPAVSAPAPAAVAALPSNAVPTWQALVLGRLEQFKRYPATAQLHRRQGVVYLRFTMDRHGKVLSARIEKSSGADALDDETLALVHRAEPLPAPPPEIQGDPIVLVVPIQFFLK